jgi:hypothetical protein
MFDMKKHCQSCGMPMKRDAGGGGTEADGTKSPDYCSKCYQGGKFTEPDITVDGMVAKVRGMMENEMHLPKLMSWWFARNIPRLGRWSRPA